MPVGQPIGPQISLKPIMKSHKSERCHDVLATEEIHEGCSL
jgi:hypothetical protein